jgi:hypothetical protein
MPACAYLGIAEGQDPGTVRIYPNPARDQLVVSAPAGTKGLQVINANGCPIITRMSGSVPLKIDLLDWPAGLYAVRFLLKDDKEQVIRFVKE